MYELPAAVDHLERISFSLPSSKQDSAGLSSPKSIQGPRQKTKATTETSSSPLSASPLSSWRIESFSSELLTHDKAGATAEVSAEKITNPTLKRTYRPYRDATSLKIGCWGTLLVTADESGRVAMWDLPKLSDAEEESLQEGESEPWAVAQLKDSWASGESKEGQASITATLVIEELLLLVCGLQNGSMTVSQLPADSSPRYIERAHNSKITCLLGYSHSPRKFIVSAGEDCAIKVWNLEYVIFHSFFIFLKLNFLNSVLLNYYKSSHIIQVLSHTLSAHNSQNTKIVSARIPSSRYPEIKQLAGFLWKA